MIEHPTHAAVGALELITDAEPNGITCKRDEAETYPCAVRKGLERNDRKQSHAEGPRKPTEKAPPG